MMGFDSYGASYWMWITGVLMMALLWGGLILLIVWGLKSVGGFRPTNPGNALEVLRTRLAAGEITQDEYENTRRLLQG